MRLGIALEGGAERSAFTAGVLDQIMEAGLPVTHITGTSAGAGCAMNFRSGQPGISFEMMILPPKERYFGIANFLRTGKFIHLDHMANLYAKRLNFKQFFHSTIHTDFTATCCETGEAVYLTEEGSIKRLLQTLKATCALPIVCSPVEVDQAHFVDGSITDPIPFQHLLDCGCDKVIVILTGTTDCKPTDYTKFKPLLWKFYHNTYPELYHTILNRIQQYDKETQKMQQAEKAGQVYVLRPQEQSIPLFTQNPNQITSYYNHGKKLATSLLPDILDWMQGVTKPEHVMQSYDILSMSYATVS